MLLLTLRRTGCLTVRAMEASLLALCLLAACAAAQLRLTGSAAVVGINYGRLGNNLPSPEETVALIKRQGFRRVKLYDSDPHVLSAFAGSGVELIVGLPNEQLRSLATSKSRAAAWIYSNVARHLPATSIRAIAVGNEVLSSNDTDLIPFLLPALANLHFALRQVRLESIVKISTPNALSILSSSFPPSAGTFSSAISSSIMRPMLDFLARTGSFVMVNAYPFFAYESDPQSIPLDYALFEPNPGVMDPSTGLLYTNLFDAQLDAFFSAMAKLGHTTLNITVAETGWPSKGDSNEVGAGVGNAARYVSNLVRHVSANTGTPLKRGLSVDAYVFALYNEDMKPGPTSERNYGLFYPDQHSVYGMNLLPPFGQANNRRPLQSRPQNAGAGRQSGSSWCVADPAAGAVALQAALDYACGLGQADCSLIQPGQPCFNPNTLLAHASFAFNSYFQGNHKSSGTCDFGGTGRLVQEDPSYDGCKYFG